MSEYKECPKCKITFKGKDIYKHFYDDYIKNGIPAYYKKSKALESIVFHYEKINQIQVPAYILALNNDYKIAALESATHYGWTKENPKTFGVNIVGIEIPGSYDGVEFWHCDVCKYTWKRFEWSNLELLKQQEWAKDFIYK